MNDEFSRILRTVPTNGKYFFPDNDYVRQVDHIGAIEIQNPDCEI